MNILRYFVKKNLATHKKKKKFHQLKQVIMTFQIVLDYSDYSTKWWKEYVKTNSSSDCKIKLDQRNFHATLSRTKCFNFQIFFCVLTKNRFCVEMNWSFDMYCTKPRCMGALFKDERTTKNKNFNETMSCCGMLTNLRSDFCFL